MKKIIIIILFFASFIEAPAQKFDLAKTPPMGWNSWNTFACNVSEKLIKEMADAMVNSGMKAAGYEYIVIDDCWQTGRDKEGNILADPERFPSGMKALSDYVHSRGLKFGLYTCGGDKTCGGRPGSMGYEFQDARSYAKWGIDYIKVDWCNHGALNAEGSYSTMRDALYATGHPILLSICEWGSTKPWEWGEKVGHMWRTTSDILNCWDCEINWGGMGWTKILDKQVGLEKYAGPGHWNDPDMLQVGNDGLTETESKSHFTMWCMLAAPLIAGNDLRTMPATIKDILTNKDVIAIDQDALGQQGFRYFIIDGTEFWVKPLQNGDVALCFFNRTNESKVLSKNWNQYEITDVNNGGKKIELKDNMVIHDVWANKDLGTLKDKIKATIPPHDVLLVRLKIK